MLLSRGRLRRLVLVDVALRTHVSGHAPLTAWLDLVRLTYVAAEHDEVNAQLVALPSFGKVPGSVLRGSLHQLALRTVDWKATESFQRLTHERALVNGLQPLW